MTEEKEDSSHFTFFDTVGIFHIGVSMMLSD